MAAAFLATTFLTAFLGAAFLVDLTTFLGAAFLVTTFLTGADALFAKRKKVRIGLLALEICRLISRSRYSR